MWSPCATHVIPLCLSWTSLWGTHVTHTTPPCATHVITMCYPCDHHLLPTWSPFVSLGPLFEIPMQAFWINLYHPCDTYKSPIYCPCDHYLLPMWSPCDHHLLPMWYQCDHHLPLLDQSLGLQCKHLGSILIFLLLMALL